MLRRNATLVLAFCGTLSACGGGVRGVPAERASVPAIAPPEGCESVRAGESLQARIDAAVDGSALCLAPGVYTGPIRVTRSLTIWGPRDAVIRSTGRGTTFEIHAASSALLGLTIDGSGGRFDLDDAAVKVAADRVRVEGIRIVNAVFGILVSASRHVVVANNDITGNGEAAMGLRGDAIRLWETHHSGVTGNVVRDGRDCVLWYSSDNVVAHNHVQGGRYGAHFMYSHRNRVHDNTFVGSIVGTFVMYSRDVELERNRFVDMSSPAGMGVGLKESGRIVLRDNVFVHSTTGLYIDTSPLSYGETDTITGNEIAHCDRGVVFHGRAEGNEFRDNVLRGNRVQVEVEGGGDALASHWRSNYFDDYQGYDLDDDGDGDVPYERRSLAADLTSRREPLSFFRGTPAMAIVEAMGKLVPLFAPHAIVRDPEPRMFEPEGVTL